MIAISLAVVTFGATQARVQNQANDPVLPSFEVASIKLDKSAFAIQHAEISTGRFTAVGTAQGLIRWAYSIDHDYQIAGGPDWIKAGRFDIEAKVEDSLVESEEKKFSEDQWRDQVRLMVRSLLADRFKLKITHETKELPVYVLVLAKNGPKIAEVKEDPNWFVSGHGPGKMQVKSATLKDFVFSLSARPELAGRLVLDKTGLQGRYSFTLEWTPENLTAIGSQAAGNAPASDSVGPSLFTALQEQLGLRLESTKARVDTIVIEHIEQPTEN
jgi:uncharacterized protein (TIGR03435 family)